jgi:diacylglycerol kinase family enzyme
MDIEKQINGTRKKIDVMKVNDFYSINVTNAGFDARVNYDQILYRSKCKTVKDAYNKAIIHNIMRPKGQKIKIICDNEIFFEGNNLLLAVGNGSTYGGGYKCAPYAVVNDGLLEVVSVKNVSVIRFAPLIKKYKEGNHLTPKLKNIIKYKQAKNIVITSSKIMTVTIDGETIHSDNVTINVLPNEISFVFPSK